MGFISEFKSFSMRGSVMDMAVGIIIGGAFGKIVTSFVNDLLMPPIGLILGGTDFTSLKFELKAATADAAGNSIAPVTVNYGQFIQTAVDFLIVAFAIFFVIKAINGMKKKEVSTPDAPPLPSTEEKLLTEIRDLLKK